MLSESDLSDAFANNAFSQRDEEVVIEEGTEKNNTGIEMKTLIRVRFSIVACWVLLALATV